MSDLFDLAIVGVSLASGIAVFRAINMLPNDELSTLRSIRLLLLAILFSLVVISIKLSKG